MTRLVCLSIGIISVVFLLNAGGYIAEQSPHAANWWSPPALAQVFLPAALLACGSYVLPLRAVKAVAGAFVLLYPVTLGTMVLAVPEDLLTQRSWPWPATIVGAVLCLAPAVLPRRGQLAAYFLVLAGALGAALWWTMQESDALWTLRHTVSNLLLGGLFAAPVATLLRNATQVDRQTEVLRASAMKRADAQGKVMERARVGAIIHDTVMAALTVVGRSGEPAVKRESAQLGLNALELLETNDRELGDISGADFVARMRQVCTEVDSTIVFTAQRSDPAVSVSAEVVRRFSEALHEAAYNSKRHAGAGTVERRAEASVGADRVTVVFADTGGGFDPAKVAPHRLGIKVGITDRIAALPGGDATIVSTPGKGTTVTLQSAPHNLGAPQQGPQARRSLIGWGKRPAPAQRTALHDDDGTATTPELPVLTAPDVVRLHSKGAALLLGAWILVEAIRAREDDVPGLIGFPLVAVVLMLCAAAALLVSRGPEPMPRLPALGVILVMPLAAWGNTAAMNGPHEYTFASYWAWTVASIFLAVLALRGRIGMAWVGQLLVTLVYASWPSYGAGQLAWPVGGYAVYQFLVLGAGSLMAVGLRRQVRLINELRARTIELDKAHAHAHGKYRERTGQLAYLNRAVLPTLQHAARGGDFSPEERFAALILEARLRDQIRAPILATAELLDLAAAARRRGTEVILLDDGGLSADPADSGKVEEVREHVAQVLESARGGKVTVRILPPGRVSVCTIVIDHPENYLRTEIPAEFRSPSAQERR